MVITNTPGKTFDKIAIDIVGPFNITKNNNKYILSIQDQLSKFIILVRLKDQTVESVSDAFIKKFIYIYIEIHIFPALMLNLFLVIFVQPY